jgi:hypothetical protein
VLDISIADCICIHHFFNAVALVNNVSPHFLKAVHIINTDGQYIANLLGYKPPFPKEEDPIPHYHTEDPEDLPAPPIPHNSTPLPPSFKDGLHLGEPPTRFILFRMNSPPYIPQLGTPSPPHLQLPKNPGKNQTGLNLKTLGRQAFANEMVSPARLHVIQVTVWVLIVFHTSLQNYGGQYTQQSHMSQKYGQPHQQC